MQWDKFFCGQNCFEVETAQINRRYFYAVGKSAESVKNEKDQL